jgi:multiple sugar transport system substrate-binding protein
LIFLSTQFKPVEEAERMRGALLSTFPGRVEYRPEDANPFNERVRAEAQSGRPTVSLIGGQHGDFATFARDGLLQDLTPLLGRLADRGFPKALTELARFGTYKHFYIPWFQGTYLLAARREALAYLPQGAALDTMTYAQWAEWGAALVRATGQRKIGLPGGPRGLLARFIHGYLYPSYTRSAGVTAFRSAEAAQMWAAFKEFWGVVHPQSTGYEFMQEPLQSGDVWVAWDHVARLGGALRAQPGEFVLFPAPIGPRGRGFVTITGGLGIPKGAPNVAGAEQLIEHLTRPAQQSAMVRELGFFPVTEATPPTDLPVAAQREADAVAQQAATANGVPTSLPVGLGTQTDNFNRLYLDTFTRIVLKNEPIGAVLDEGARTLQTLLNTAQAPCWSPDPLGDGPCTVQ